MFTIYWIIHDNNTKEDNKTKESIRPTLNLLCTHFCLCQPLGSKFTIQQQHSTSWIEFQKNKIFFKERVRNHSLLERVLIMMFSMTLLTFSEYTHIIVFILDISFSPTLPFPKSEQIPQHCIRRGVGGWELLIPHEGPSLRCLLLISRSRCTIVHTPGICSINNFHSSFCIFKCLSAMYKKSSRQITS